MPQSAICKISGKPFIHTDSDLEFYKKISVPPPTLCPEERRRRRFTFRNERFLYKRKSALSGKEIISCMHPDSPQPVYNQEEWYGDTWDGADYARPYDFNRPFFDQYKELQKVVPTIAINGSNNENCPYANYAAACKNCHLIFGSVYCEDCLYGNPYYCKSCIDSLLVRDSELCYECVTCEKCYECFYCQDCAGSFGLLFCYDCHGSKNCIGCTGLRNKEYYIFNKAYSKEDFLKAKAALNLCDPQQFENLKLQFEALKLKYPRRFAVTLQTENSTGDYVYSSKNAADCYDVQRLEDCRYCAQVIDMKDCQDCNYMEECELCYEYICHFQNQRIFFSVWCHASHDIWYSSYCVSSSDLFGCIGLKHKQYCILNKQYTKGEYEDLRSRIVEQMKTDGSFGEFFHPSLSLFCYNETVAQEYFPLTKEEALQRGYRWRDKDPKDYQPQTYRVPQNIKEVPDSIINEILACHECKKNFRVERAEVSFYKRYGLPLPSKCPDCRHRTRLALRNPRMLFERNCKKCGVGLQSTYAPERPEQVYCEKCYLEMVY
ncbi:hypothetical protein HYW83_03525 [Candidatus Peregrinibacteria bacterium]|nr:hypothetical protein [Candidatus Peregrinibacteria bacterium]